MISGSKLWSVAVSPLSHGCFKASYGRGSAVSMLHKVESKGYWISYPARPSILWAGLQELQDEVLGVGADVPPVALVEDNLRVAALVDEILQILGAKRRVAAKQGISDDAHRPHIDWLSVPLFQHDFGGGVSKGTGHGGEHLVLAVEVLRDAEVGKHKIGIGCLCEVE